MANSPRKKFLIEPQFQISYSLKLSLIAFLGTVFSSLIIYAVIMSIQSDLKSCEQFIPFLNECLNKESFYKAQIVTPLLVFVITFCSFTFLWGILITHKVAGPVFVLKKHFKSFFKGEDPQIRPLRQKDQLKDVYEEFKNFFKKIKENENNYESKLIKIKETLETKAIPNLEKNDLESLKKELNEILEVVKKN